MEKIGSIVKEHRKHSGLSRIELAEIAGVGKTLIYDIEHGKDSVRFAGLKKVLDALNIKIVLQSPLMNLLQKKEPGYAKS
ncbi:MAG: helix-turn-helix transcriptional regulator [bacterium]|nr:helix-turn-helix transcriptional regulator [bacterium]